MSTAADFADVVAPDIPPNRPIHPLDVHQRNRLSIVPERIVPLWPLPRRGATALMILCALAVHGGFAALFILLLDWRDFPAETEKAISVEIVASVPDMPKPSLTMAAPQPSPPPAPPPAPPLAADTGVPPPFLARPPEPMRAATELSPRPPAEPDRQAARPEPTTSSHSPPVETPEVLSAPQGGFSVPSPAPNLEKTLPQAPGKLAPSPRLADVLPMDLSALPSTFRAVLSGSGAQTGNEYKGLVYGRIQRSHRAIEEAAARHLRGQVIVAFSVDPDGRAGDLRIAKSSGIAAVDALGLQMVREAEPFASPPPGSRQIFTPAFAFGQEE